MKKIILNFIVPAVIVCCVVFIPKFTVNFDINTALTVAALIFAILMGFFIAASMTNYLNLQAYISEEDISLMNVFSMTKIIQLSAVQGIREKIDNYVTKTLDFSLKEYIGNTQKEFDALVNGIDELIPADDKGLAVLSVMFDERNKLVHNRQKISLASKEIIKFAHWTILILLSVIIMGLILVMRDGSLISYIVISLLSISIYYILILLYKIDANILLEEHLSYSNSQIVFTALGVPKYFPESTSDSTFVKTLKEDYRIGVYKGEYGKSEREIKVINYEFK